jgi:hypothetical protein
MKKITVMRKVQELANTQHALREKIAINSSELATIMQTFGVTWIDVKQPLNTFFLSFERVKSDQDLINEFQHNIKILRLAKEKNQEKNEYEMKLMIAGFIKGVNFFNDQLAEEFAAVMSEEYKEAV